MRKSLGSWGILLTRGQPFHKGHIEVIKKALEENEYVLVVIGSADKSGVDRNPLPIETRINLFSRLETYLGYDSSPRLQYICLDDWSSDNEIPYESVIGSDNSDFEAVSGDWGMYFYYNIVSHTFAKSFTFYYNDNADIIQSWFPSYISQRITVKNAGRVEGYSSSQVRQAFRGSDYGYLKEALPYLSEEDIKIIQKEINV